MALSPVIVLNTIRDEANAAYQARIPLATRNNLAEIGQFLAENQNDMNTYISGLLNDIGKRYVIAKLYRNKFSILKGADVPYGSTINEIYVNPSIDQGYSKDQALLLKTTTPDGKVAYYGKVRTAKYPVTLTEQSIMQAFRNETEYMSWFSGVISSMYSGDNIDEELLIKGLFGKVVEAGGIRVLASPIGGTTDAEMATNAKALAKNISIHSKHFATASRAYAGYNFVNAGVVAGTETPAITWADLEDQCLIITAEAETEMDYEYLASLYHIELARLKAMTITVDYLPCTTHKINAILCDKSAIRFNDAVYKMKNTEIGSSLEWNYWLHHHEFIYISMFANIIAFGEALEVI